MNQTPFSKLLYIVLLFALVACQAQATSTTISPTVAPTTSPPTAVPATAAPTVASDQALTTFSPKRFNLPITLSHGPEWSIAEEYSDEFLLNYAGHDAGIAFINVKNAKIADGLAFPDDFATWIQSPDSLFQVVDSKPILVDGFKGIQFNTTAACGDTKYWIMLPGTGWKCPGVERIDFIYLNDVNGERVLIQIQPSPDGKDYEFIVEESQKVLDTVVFSKPTTTFSSETFALPISVSLGSQWKVTEDYPDVVTLMSDDYYVDLAFILVKDIRLADPKNSFEQVAFPDDFVTWIQEHGLFPVVKRQPVVVAGFQGTEINAIVTSDCGVNKKSWLFYSSNAWNCRTDEYYHFIYLEDVYGERLLIMNSGGPASEKDFTVGVEASQKVLATVVFSRPTTAIQSTYPLLVEHTIPTAASEPGGIVTGPDGALWFVETAVNKIGRIAVDSVVTEYSVPTAHAIDTDQGFLAVGPDDALWFNEDLVNQIGRITTEGQVTEYKLPDEFKPAEDPGVIRAMVAGPDGALWVTSPGANAIVKLTTDGTVAATYALPKAESIPVGMVLGSDGALWFVEKGANQIGRITLDGKLSEYALPDISSGALRITVGADKALWFTMISANKIGRITTDGVITTFDAGGTGPVGIASGPDGAIWFTGYVSTEIGRLTTDGQLTKIQIPTAASAPYHITAGPDGNLWFTEQQGNKIGQVKLSAP
jgi:virginiamycin B lyase